MMQPVQSTQSQRSGEHATPIAENSTQAITVGQMKVLNNLVSHLSSVTGQPETEIWTLLRQALSMTGDDPLLSRHFPPAEQHLNQRLMLTQQTNSQQRLLNQVIALIDKSNNRQQVSNYLTQQFGRASLHMLTSNQLHHLLDLLQNGKLTDNASRPPSGTQNARGGTYGVSQPASAQRISVQDIPRLSQAQLGQILNETLNRVENRTLANHYLQQQFGHNLPDLLNPQQQKTVLALLLSGQFSETKARQPPATQPLSSAELKTLNQLIVRLTHSNGETPARIWQTLLTLSEVSSPQHIPGNHFTELTHWLLTQQHLAQQPAATLQDLYQHLQQTMRPPVTDHQWQQLINYGQQQWQASPQSPLNASQIQQVLFFISQARIHQQQDPVSNLSRSPAPIYSPLLSLFSDPIKTLNTRPGLLLVAAIMVVIIFMIVI